jgi:hypothetical protein
VKDFSVWLVGLLLLSVGVLYVYKIWKHDISPTLSMWIIFSLGTGLSLVTYLIAEKRDFRSGILNTVDVIGTAAIVLAIILWGEHGVRLKSFEKWYLVGVGVIITYGLLTGDAWTSNIFTQVLISLGYFPTIQTLVTEKRNTESFVTWGLNGLVGLIALYPAMVDGNSLAIVYSARSIVSIAILLCIMTYYEVREKETKS